LTSPIFSCEYEENTQEAHNMEGKISPQI